MSATQFSAHWALLCTISMQSLTALITRLVDQGKRAGIGEEPKRRSNFLLHAHQLAAGVNVYMATVGPHVMYVSGTTINTMLRWLCTIGEGTGLHTYFDRRPEATSEQHSLPGCAEGGQQSCWSGCNHVQADACCNHQCSLHNVHWHLDQQAPHASGRPCHISALQGGERIALWKAESWFDHIH